MPPQILAVALSPNHSFSKSLAPEINILAGLGVEGDAHAGVTVRHRYCVRQNPSAPNLTQVHLLQSELFEELASQQISLGPGDMGENITTLGIDLLELPLGTRLHLGAEAIVEITGLRQPCSQMNKLRPGLMQACLLQSPQGKVLRKAGVMGIALASGTIRPGDGIVIELPPLPHRALGPV